MGARDFKIATHAKDRSGLFERELLGDRRELRQVGSAILLEASVDSETRALGLGAECLVTSQAEAAFVARVCNPFDTDLKKKQSLKKMVLN